MGFVEYNSRNPCNQAKPISKYDEEFVIAQIGTIRKTLHIINETNKKKKRPTKKVNLYKHRFLKHQSARQAEKNVSNNKVITSTKQQSSNNYNSDLQSRNEYIKATKQSKLQSSNEYFKDKQLMSDYNSVSNKKTKKITIIGRKQQSYTIVGRRKQS